MSTNCSTLRCKKEEIDTGVGTSTNCSAVCGARRTVRAARGGQTILGTSINLLGNTDIKGTEHVHPALGPRSAPRCAAVTAPAAGPQREEAAASTQRC